MKVFKVKITEELCRIVEVNAINEENAIEEIKRQYYKERIVFYPENINEISFKIEPTQET